jgi:hypothetical protein
LRDFRGASEDGDIDGAGSVGNDWNEYDLCNDLEVSEETDVSTEATLRAGESDRWFVVVDDEAERECAGK